MIGLGVGAGAGAAVGAAARDDASVFHSDNLDTAVHAGLTIIGAGVGALVGDLIGRKGRKRVLIYEAKQP